jgi:putative hydrolase of the HAD superfamily
VAIKTIIFDLGRVIVPFEFDRAYRRIEALTGLTRDAIRARIGSTDLVQRFESGQVAPREFVRRLSGQLGFDLEYQEFCEIWSSIFLPDPLVPVSLIEHLRARYRMLLLSNTNAIHFEMVRGNFPHIGHFHHCVLSHEVGALKPDPAIYRAALDNAHCRPEECFFTDDIPEFVEGARRMGIDAVQFAGYEALLGELRRRGIEV